MRIGLRNGSSRGKMGAGWTSNENNGFMFNVFFGSFLCTDLGARMVPKGFPLWVTLGTLFMFVGVRFGVPVDASMLTSFGEPSGRENVVFSMEWLSKTNVWVFQKSSKHIFPTLPTLGALWAQFS